MSPPPTLQDLLDAPKRYKIAGITDEWEARFVLMADHWLLQTAALELCNKQVGKTREWSERQKHLEQTNETSRHSD